MLYILILIFGSLGLLSPFIAYALIRKTLLLILPTIVAGVITYQISVIVADLSAWGDGATVKTISNLEVFSIFLPIVLLFNGLLILPLWLIERDRRKQIPAISEHSV